MNRLVKRLLLGGGLVVPIGTIVGWAVVEVRWRTRTFDAPYPPIHASTDSAVIARGRELAYGVASCAYCHSRGKEWPSLAAGAEPPLTGSHLFPLPIGNFYSANLTPDPETGIGRRTDAELARALRYGVGADGRALLGFMQFHDMSDEDLTAVISYLRAQPPVRSVVAKNDPTALGKALFAFAVEPPRDTSTPPRMSPAVAPTVERGAYLVKVAQCSGCHTHRDHRTEKVIGGEMAGGERMGFAADPTKVFVTPNLTPEPYTGRMASWTEEQFIARFRQGALIQGSIMPWGAYRRLSDTDLRAIYRYLRTLPPVVNEPGPALQERTAP